MTGRAHRGGGWWGGLLALVLLAVSGCRSVGQDRSDEPLGAVARFWLVESDEALLSGPAVDASVVCAAARIARVGFEDVDGEPITEGEFQRLVVEALETGEITAGTIYREYRCDDGSGSFVIAERPVVSAGSWDFYGFNDDVATWEVHSGTGAYAELSGQGSIDVDYDSREWLVSGEFQGAPWAGPVLREPSMTWAPRQPGFETERPSSWAREAENWHAAMVEHHLAVGAHTFDHVLSPDATWDSGPVKLGEPVRAGTTLRESVQHFQGPESLAIGREVFTNASGFVVPFAWDARSTYVGEPGRIAPLIHGVMRLEPIDSTGADAVVMASSIGDWRMTHPADWPHAETAEAIASDWLAVWSGEHEESIEVYRPDARLTDSIAAHEVTGVDAIARLAADTARDWTIATLGVREVRGIHPLTRGLTRAGSLEEVVLVVEAPAGGGGNARSLIHGCGARMLVWLTLHDDLVVDEDRYWPTGTPSRCLPGTSQPTGWWTDLPTPTVPEPGVEDLETPTEPVVVAGSTIATYNSTPNLNRLLEWGVGRYDAAGLELPPIVRATFTQYSAFCDDIRAKCRLDPDGAALTFCWDERTACADSMCEEFLPGIEAVVLHELAHVWLAELDATTKQAFTGHVELDTWDDPAVGWGRRAHEHAADTMAWALMDTDVHMLRIDDPPDDHLAEGFRILTRLAPINDTQPASG